MKRFLSGLYLVVVLLLCGYSTPAQAVGDVYFGTLDEIDPAHGVVTMNVQNVDIHQKGNGLRRFWTDQATNIQILGASGKPVPNRHQLTDVLGTHWVWVRSVDGGIATQIVATIYQAFEGRVTAIDPGGPSLRLQVERHWIGRRYSNVSAKKAPRSFFISPTVPCDYKGKPVDLAMLRVGMRIKIVTDINGTNAARIGILKTA